MALSGTSVLLGVLVSLARSDTLLVYILRCCGNLATAAELTKEMTSLGIIHVLLSLLELDTELPGSDVPATREMPKPACIIAVCATLTQLAMDDESAYQIRKDEGVTILGHMLMASSDKEVQMHVLRAMRFVYSVEKNRKMYKRLFPPDIFADFIDIGNYVYEFGPYKALVKQINGMPQVNQFSLGVKTRAFRCVSGQFALACISE